MTLRWLTAGESHGPALVGILEGMPAAVPIEAERIERQLARRRIGHGRSPRMDFEVDRFEIVGGVRHGRTLGSPIAIIIHNTEWPKWTEAMAVEAPDDPAAVNETGRGRPLTRPRPGHADLAGAQKYGFDDVRNVLERASARETAARVALAACATALLEEAGIQVISHTVGLGRVVLPDDIERPGAADVARIDSDPVRCLDEETSERMQEEVDWAVENLETLGGVIEILVSGLPPGLGSYVHWDRRLDGRLARALMSVPGYKAVEIGGGFELAHTPGSAAHDEIESAENGGYRRRTGRAGGLEGGVTNGEILRLRAAMKPISSLKKPLDTVDTATGEPAKAITQRSDTTSVPRSGIVCEAVVALTIADALLEKTGGDSLGEVLHNLAAYRDGLVASRGDG